MLQNAVLLVLIRLDFGPLPRKVGPTPPAKDEAKAGIAWWKIRSGELKNKQLTSSTAGSVAGDLRAIAQEINDRLIAAESHPELEGTHA